MFSTQRWVERWIVGLFLSQDIFASHVQTVHAPRPLQLARIRDLELRASLDWGALISVGFAAMYIESAYLGPISLYVSPVLIVSGYAEIIYALMWAPDEDEASQEA